MKVFPNSSVNSKVVEICTGKGLKIGKVLCLGVIHTKDFLITKRVMCTTKEMTQLIIGGVR
jgi:hypothetical protein